MSTQIDITASNEKSQEIVNYSPRLINIAKIVYLFFAVSFVSVITVLFVLTCIKFYLVNSTDTILVYIVLTFLSVMLTEIIIIITAISYTYKFVFCNETTEMFLFLKKTGIIFMSLPGCVSVILFIWCKDLKNYTQDSPEDHKNLVYIYDTYIEAYFTQLCVFCFASFIYFFMEWRYRQSR